MGYHWRGQKVIRDSALIKESNIKALKYFKEEVKQIKADHECGILLSEDIEFKVGDTIEAFEVIENQEWRLSDS